MALEKKRAFIIHFLYFLICVGISYFVLRYGFPLVTPFLFAFGIAALIHRPSVFLSQKLKGNYKVISLVVLVLFYSCIGLILSVLGIQLIAGCRGFFEALPQIYAEHIAPVLTHIFDAIEAHIFHIDIPLFQNLEELELQFLQSSGSLFSELSMIAAQRITHLATAIPGLFMKTLMMIISSFFIVADYDRITGFCANQMRGKIKTVFYQIKNYVVNTLLVCIRSYLLIMAITFSELVLGLWILGVEHVLVISLLIAVFDILPVLGVGGVLIPWGIVCILLGNYPMSIGLFILYIIIIVIRNILEPKIVGKQIGLHPVVTLCSMFVGVQLFGILGLFGFPIGLSLLRHLYETDVIHFTDDKRGNDAQQASHL